MSELTLDAPPRPGCSGGRGKGGGGAAAEAHPGCARGCWGALREGAGRALRGCARGWGAGLEQAWRDSRNKELRGSARGGARGGDARGGLESLAAEARSPRSRRGEGRGTWLFCRGTTLRFCSTTGLPGSLPRLGLCRLEIRRLSPSPNPHLIACFGGLGRHPGPGRESAGLNLVECLLIQGQPPCLQAAQRHRRKGGGWEDSCYPVLKQNLLCLPGSPPTLSRPPEPRLQAKMMPCISIICGNTDSQKLVSGTARQLRR